jgi:DHA1 family tetracycline resistance protein-like MFS transporter
MKARALFIFITIVIDSIGIGIIIPVLPDVMRRFISDEALVSSYFGYFIAIYALMQFLASPFLGGLSDRYGRRPILLLSLLGGALDYVLMAFAPSLWVLFLGRVISGLTGANITVAQAYIADVSDDSNRAKNFGMMGAGFGLGFIIGPAIGGLLGGHNVAYPFLAAAAFSFLNFLFGLFVLPESLPENMRRHVEIKKLNPFRSLSHVFRPSPIRGFIFVFILLQLAGQVHPAVWTLFTEYQFGWTAGQVGLSLSMVGVLSAISQGWLTGIVVKKLGEFKTALAGTFGCALAFMLFATATQGWMMYAILAGSSIFWVGQPALQSLVSKHTPPQEQGELQGSLMSLMSLCSIATPLIATSLFAHFTHGERATAFAGAPYVFAAIASFASLAIMLRLKPEEVA